MVWRDSEPSVTGPLPRPGCLPQHRVAESPTGAGRTEERPQPMKITRPDLGAPLLAVVLLAGTVLAACQPTVKVEAPQEPITINLNIKLDAEVRLKIEEQAQEDIAANPDIF